MDDDIYKELVHFYSVSVGKYPDRIVSLEPVKRSSDKSNFRQIAKPYHVTDGILMYGSLKVLVKSSLANVLYSFHEIPSTGRHIGRDKMHDKIKEIYYWKGMRRQINEYIQSCTICSAGRSKIIMETPPLHLSNPTKLWSQVSIDIIGPLEESNEGNRFIVVAADHFSKWTEAAAIRTGTPERVGNFLFNIICRFGCMDMIITDQGSEFNDKLLNGLTNQFKIEHKIKCADPPQFNGQCIGNNKTLIEALFLLENEHGDEWEIFIPGVLLEYHSTINASIKCTPFEMMYGRILKLPSNNKTPVDITDAVDVEIKEEHVL